MLKAQEITEVTLAVYEARAEVMKALAHPSRLMMLDALAEKEMCVCELREIVGSSMPTVSRHLAQMRNAGIVDSRRDGNQIYYRLVVPCVLRMFSCIDAVLHSEAERTANALAR
ncbi:MAG TPA: transcriptional regulator [Armatimonadetes bacterium]|nr:transcriptional regulator [Armatimonadota bacterium]